MFTILIPKKPGWREDNIAIGAFVKRTPKMIFLDRGANRTRYPLSLWHVEMFREEADMRERAKLLLKKFGIDERQAAADALGVAIKRSRELMAAYAPPHPDDTHLF